MKKSSKKLYRSRSDKIIAGVCGGMAEYFDVEAIWIRLFAVLLLFGDGAGFFLYVIAWIIIPENPSQKPAAKTKAEKMVGKTSLLGIAIVAVGILLLLKNLFPWFSMKIAWPIAIIMLGIFLLQRKQK